MEEQGAQQYEWRTAIAEFHRDRIRIRGYDLMELIDKIDFASAVYLLFKGELPSPEQAKMINAIFVAVCDHGISPSATVSRFVAASGVPIQVATAAGILTFGDIHGGAGEEFAKMVQEEVRRARREGKSLDQVAEEIVSRYRSEGKRAPGYGHPQHPAGDPRCDKLLSLAEQLGVAGDHVKLARAIEKVIEARAGRRIAINGDGAIASIVSDLGMDWRLARAFIVIPRSAGLMAHSWEEMVREAGWRQIKEEHILYDGPPPRSLSS